ncbi:MAG: hypothetical protein Q8N06_00780 [Hydrogenophaga sp.]|nr:hypothetical protein [Hydrogenophaga sp.]
MPTATLVRRIAKAIDKLCECDPNGYSKPTLTFLSISKMIASGHVPAVFGITIPGQSTFDATVVPDQSFVDTVVIRTGTPSTTKDGNLSYYVSNVGFIVGKARGASTKGLRLIVAPSCVNKGSPYKPNEVISFYPEVEGLIK